MLPSFFISHGSPDIRLTDHEIRDFLMNLGSKFEKPKSIIIISAHWYTRHLEILTNKNPNIIYDFYGFPEELYQVKYPIKNDLSLVDKIITKLKENNINVFTNSSREGYDHGVWSILSLIYPNLDIPVVQLSLPISYSTDDLMQLGGVLKEFREDSLIIGSGNITHNLRDLDWRGHTHIKEYAKEFRNFMVAQLENSNIDKLKNLDNLPYLRQNHPSLDHLLPLYVNIGSSNDKKGESMIESYMFGALAMDTIIFRN
jgi:4,5-DOPA dioxygenase extradiol